MAEKKTASSKQINQLKAENRRLRQILTAASAQLRAISRGKGPRPIAARPAGAGGITAAQPRLRIWGAGPDKGFLKALNRQISRAKRIA